MRRTTAIKTITKCADWYILKRLAYNSSIYSRGISKDPAFERAYKEHQKILVALETIKEQT